MAGRGLSPLHLVQILLPLYDNENHAFDDALYVEVRRELTERFGGLTAFTRAPAEGLWKDDPGRTSRDDIVVLEVMSDELDLSWWRAYRGELERRFRQDEIVIRAQEIERL